MTAAIEANIVQFLFPFVFTIVFSNFVVSILVDTYLRTRSIASTQHSETGGHSAFSALAGRYSTTQVCSAPHSSRRRHRHSSVHVVVVLIGCVSLRGRAR